MAKKKSRSFKSGEPVRPEVEGLDSDKPGAEELEVEELAAEEAEAIVLKVEEPDSEELGADLPVITESETETPHSRAAQISRSETEEPDTGETDGPVLKTGGSDANETDKPEDDASDDQAVNEPIRVKRRQRRTNLSPRTRRLLYVAVALWIGALGVIGVRQFAVDFSKPLGEPLGDFGASGRVESEAVLADRNSDQVDSFGLQTGQPVTSDGRSPQCGGPAEMTVMLVGVDSGFDIGVRGLADTIRVVHLDFVRPRIAVLSVPRILWVEAPLLSDHAVEMHRYFGTARDPDGNRLNQNGPYGMLNATYFYGNKHEVPGSGPTVLAEALYVNLGVPVDHYAAISITTLEDIIDAVGGVDVNVPYAITGWDAGYQHMTGPQVVTYARQRQDDSDWYRVERQNVVLAALWDKMSEPRNLVKVPGLTDRFIDEILTDLSKAQIASIACLMTRVGPDEVEYFPITPEMVTVSDTTVGFFILLPNPEAIDPLVRAFFTGS